MQHFRLSQQCPGPCAWLLWIWVDIHQLKVSSGVPGSTADLWYVVQNCQISRLKHRPGFLYFCQWLSKMSGGLAGGGAVLHMSMHRVTRSTYVHSHDAC